MRLVLSPLGCLRCTLYAVVERQGLLISALGRSNCSLSPLGCLCCSLYAVVQRQSLLISAPGRSNCSCYSFNAPVERQSLVISTFGLFKGSFYPAPGQWRPCGKSRCADI